jgi:hypothetical protein
MPITAARFGHMTSFKASCRQRNVLDTLTPKRAAAA